MLEKHYSHLTPTLAAKQLAGKQFPDRPSGISDPLNPVIGKMKQEVLKKKQKFDSEKK